MDIVTAKPTLKERAGIPHHLLDVVEPTERYTVAQFKEATEDLIKEIRSRGRLPIMVGGTGLYIDSVLFDYQFAGPDAERDSLNPRHAKSTDQSDRQQMRPDAMVVGLHVPKEVLERRIEKRIEQMLAEGLETEVKELAEIYGWGAPGLQAPAYKAFHEYIEGAASLDEAKAAFKRYDLQLAKRQYTWFKRNDRIQWFDDHRKLVDFITTKLDT
jgi:tRNA dimethylallyltransferase